MSDVPPPTELLAETPAAPTELPPAHRAAADAAKVWADTLIDRTGRNELLFCKDRGKILLDGADPVVLDRLLHGEQVRLKQLFKDEATQKTMAKTAESIRRRIREYDEERGVRIGRLVFAFASWTESRPTARGNWGGRRGQRTAIPAVTSGPDTVTAAVPPPSGGDAVTAAVPPPSGGDAVTAAVPPPSGGDAVTAPVRHHVGTAAPEPFVVEPASDIMSDEAADRVEPASADETLDLTGQLPGGGDATASSGTGAAEIGRAAVPGADPGGPAVATAHVFRGDLTQDLTGQVVPAVRAPRPALRTSAPAPGIPAPGMPVSAPNIPAAGIQAPAATGVAAAGLPGDVTQDLTAQLAPMVEADSQIAAEEDETVSTAMGAVGIGRAAVPGADPADAADPGEAGAAATAGTSQRDVRAPVLLRDLVVTYRPGRDDYDIVADKDVEISPVLLHYLRTTFRAEIDDELIEELNDLVDDPARVEEALTRFAAAVTDVPGFHITPGALIGTFHYAKLAMHEDLLDNAGVFAAGELVAAMAGDLGAIAAVRKQVGDVTLDAPDLAPPADEYLVLDADPFQHYAINAALAGRNLIVQGPPGTGKSQTISNLIATFAANGRSVLFVAEKRAAIDAVLGRLAEAGLHDLTLDLHVTTANRSRAYESFRAAIGASREATAPDTTRLHARLERSRATLREHDIAMHTPRQPWGVSVHDAQVVTFGTPPEARADIALDDATVDALDGERAEQARVALVELTALGGMQSAQSRGPWAAALFDTDAEAARAAEVVAQLKYHVLELHKHALDGARRIGVPAPGSPREAAVMVALGRRTADVAAKWSPEIYAQDLGRLIAAADPSQTRHNESVPHGVATPETTHVGFWARRKLVKEALALRVDPRRKPDRAKLAADLREVAEVAAEWARITGGAPPEVPDLAGASAAEQASGELFTELTTLVDLPDLRDRPWPQVVGTLDEFARDPRAPHAAARIARLVTFVRGAGLGDLLAFLSRVAPTWPDPRRKELVAAAFDLIWCRAILARLVPTDPHLASFDGSAHTTVVDDFVAADRAHAVANRQRVRRRVAEHLTEVRQLHPDQDIFLDRELGKKRRLRPLRDLVHEAPDVLLAAKPCWAMSPLLVSQLLPPQRLFDVVIFDEASQVQPAEAIPALARARSAVIAGDSRQLPPTAFFEAAVDAEAERTDSDLLTDDADSVLEAFHRALGASLAHEYYLGWHYRSQDARLIAPSNAYFYDNRMVTFPGTMVDPPLRFVEVPGAESADGTSPQEVKRVVELMIEHAAQRPTESLGVITMGVTHAIRIEDELNRRLRSLPQMRDWFDAKGPEPCFVKNLERVQGDERDAIILAVGYGKQRGRMMYRFGPLNMKGGQRRLNVAISRAKRRMTVVAGFTPDELDSTKLNSEGAKRLADFLRYAAGGAAVTASAPDAAGPAEVGLSPFEMQVRDKLRVAGVPVECRVGVGASVIDFAARHPSKRGRMVLAIESDGTTYHAAATVRARDRLRREQLERLGWHYHRIWSTDWFRDADREVARVRAAYEAAVQAADKADEAALLAAAAAAAGAAPIPPPARNAAPARATATVPPPREPRPEVPAGEPINEYSDRDLIAIIDWVATDGRLRTDAELKRDVRTELGFKRNGARIEERLTAAIAQTRQRQAPVEAPPDPT